MSEFELATEERVAADMGISRPKIKEIREKELKEGRDWRMVRKMVTYTEDGLKKIGGALSKIVKDASGAVASLAMPSAEEKQQGGHTAARDHGVKETTLCVIHLSRNPGVLMCVKDCEVRRLPDNRVDPKQKHGGLYRVRVRDNKKFMQGMTLTARHIEADRWEFVGRMPRWRGRW